METKTRILIVDDNEDLCNSLRDTFVDDGYAIEISNNGNDAIHLSQNNVFDVALIDFNLPDISGTELVNNLINISPLTEFVYITAHAALDNVIEAVRQERVISYEIKPLDIARLRFIFNQVARRREDKAEIHKLTHALKFCSSMIVITDKRGRIEYVNPKYTQHTGYTSEEVIGKSPSILKSGKTSPEVYKELWKTIKSGSEWKGEFCNRKKNGELYWESASISSVKNPEGVIRNFIAVSDDITDNKQKEDERRKLSSLLSSIIESPEKIIIFALDTRCNYLSFNLAHVKEMKRVYDADIEIGRNILTYIPREDDRLRADENFNRVLKGERFVQIEEYGQADSRYRYELSFNPIYDNLDHVTGFTVFVSDVTDRMKMEDALLQSEKLKSIGTITAGISHEFNNILTVISGKVQLLEMIYKDNKELTDELGIIKRAADDGAEISSNMLKFTKTHQDTKEFVSFDIRDLIRHSIEFTKPRWENEAQSRGIDYEMDVESMKRVPSIMCKPAELREIFINIIKNSLDAMPEGGRLSFSTWSADDTVFIGVSDTGMGMHDKVKKNIFDPFFTTKGVAGAGLGMSITYGIVTRHGGSIEVESEIGKGTTFTLQFPTTNKNATLIETPDAEQETNENNLRILVVDDEAVIRDILDQFLTRGGHKVKTVDNGSDAIKMVGEEDFDLVLCDLAMPNVFGYDVVKALNGLKKRPKIGVISGGTNSFASIADKELKIDFYLKKPFKHAELINHINDAFGMDGKR